MTAARTTSVLLALRAGLASSACDGILSTTTTTSTSPGCGSGCPGGTCVEFDCSWSWSWSSWSWSWSCSKRCEYVTVTNNCCSGWTGDNCETPISQEPTPLTVATLNLGCRSAVGLEVCDNCEVRFMEIAQAIKDDEDYLGVPDFDSIDVLLVQEFSVDDPALFQIINQALTDKGFKFSTGLPGPTSASPQCSDPPDHDDLFFNAAFSTMSQIVEWLGAVSTSVPQNGGLVTWSKHKIESQFDRQWCFHGFPVPAGFLVTLINKDGFPVAVVNTHLYPDYDFTGVGGPTPKDVRSRQFNELRDLTTALAADEDAYSVIVGGDFNEDMYGGELTSDGQGEPPRDCSKIQPNAREQFAKLELDLDGACEEADFDFGKPTWDPRNNDLTNNRANNKAKVEVLDYIVMTHSPVASVPTGAGERQNVGVFRKNSKWNGNACSAAGWVLPWVDEDDVPDADFEALSDHNWVSARFEVPQAGNVVTAKNAFCDGREIAGATCAREGDDCCWWTGCCALPGCTAWSCENWRWEGWSLVGTCEREQ